MVTFKTALSLYSGHSDQGKFTGRIQCMCSHPSLAWVASVSSSSEPSSGKDNTNNNNNDNSNSSNTSSNKQSSLPQHHQQSQCVTVWDYQRGETLIQWSYVDLLEALGTLKQQKLSSTKTNLGSIRSVQFMDRHTLYWNGCHPQGENDLDDEPLLIVLFEFEIVTLYLRNYISNAAISTNKGSRTATVSMIHSTLAYTELVQQQLQQSFTTYGKQQQQPVASTPCYPTCVQVITRNIFIVGCSDGSIQFWNNKEKAIIRVLLAQQQQSPLSPSNVTSLLPAAAILQIIPAVSISDLYAAEHNTSNTSGITIEEESANNKVSSYRFVSVGSNGIAHVWKMQIITAYENNDNINDLLFSPSSPTYTLKIKRPLARMQSLLVAVSTHNNNNDNPTTTAYYDMERDLFFSPLLNMKYLAVWDFSSMPSSSTTSTTPEHTNSNNSTPLFLPFLRIITSPNIIFPSTSSSATTANNNKAWSVLPVQNPYYISESCITFWMTNKSTGDAFFMVSSIHDNNSSNNNNNLEVKPEVHHECTISSLDYVTTNATTSNKQQQQHQQRNSSKLKLNCWIIPRGRCEILCGTNCGIVKLEVFPSARTNTSTMTQTRSGTRHVILSEYSDNTKQVVILFVEGPSVFVATLDAAQVDPIGPLIVRNPCLVYKSVIAAADELLLLSSTSDYYETITSTNTSTTTPSNSNNHNDVNSNNNIRLPPKLFLSPSKSFVCLFWSFEMRYEILHVKSLLEHNNNINKRLLGPLIETGTSVRSFAWEGIHDVFAILRAGTSTTTSSVQTSMNAAKQPKRFDFSAKLKKSSLLSSTPTGGGSSVDTPLLSSATSSTPTSTSMISSNKRLDDVVVELRMMISVNVDAVAMSSCAAATVRSMGELPLRGGQPVSLFGGAVLCVASTQPGMTTSMESNSNKRLSEGLAYFYVRKQTADAATTSISELKASAYSASGPSLPIPDLVEWSDDGQYCCACFGPRVAIYSFRPPEFSLIGTVMLNPSDSSVVVEAVKFLHNVLFCSTSTSVQLIFLASISSGGSITSGDTYMLASMHVPSIKYDSTSFPPIPLPMSLGNPAPLTFFAGSLVISTCFGIQAIPLDNPIYRIGILLAAGHTDRAQQWFQGIDRKHHEALGRFLERRGYPELATSLPGLSITSVVDMCIRWRLTKVLEDLIESNGLEGIRGVDIGSNVSFGAIECVGAFLLSEGKAELVRRLASECVVSGDEMKRESLVLASLLLSVDPSDARRLVKRAVGAKGKVDEEKYWPVANYVRNHLL